jgi:O-antigen ligase
MRGTSLKLDAGIILLTLLLGWMLLQIVPLPPAWVAHLSPNVWHISEAARIATSQDLNSWLPLSTSPALTLGRLLDVIPAMAAFVALREIGGKPGRRMWPAGMAIVVIASIEAALGLMQLAGGAAPHDSRVSGTYVNPNHFAGLLETAFPLCIAWAAARWKRGRTRRTFPASIVWQIAGALSASALLMLAVFASLSRMAAIAMSMSLTVILIALLIVRGPDDQSNTDAVRNPRTTRARGAVRLMSGAAAVIIPVIVLAFLSPVQAILRFATPDQLSGDGRIGIWHDTVRLIRAYPWTGGGLGTFERALSPFRTFAPNNTVDFAHNDYLQIVAELGWPGALLMAALAAWILWSVVRVIVRKRGTRNWELTVGIMGALVAMGVHSLTDFNLYIPANALVLAWLAGVAVSPAVQEARE